MSAAPAGHDRRAEPVHGYGLAAAICAMGGAPRRARGKRLMVPEWLKDYDSIVASIVGFIGLLTGWRWKRKHDAAQRQLERRRYIDEKLAEIDRQLQAAHLADARQIGEMNRLSGEIGSIRREVTLAQAMDQQRFEELHKLLLRIDESQRNRGGDR